MTSYYKRMHEVCMCVCLLPVSHKMLQKFKLYKRIVAFCTLYVIYSAFMISVTL